MFRSTLSALLLALGSLSLVACAAENGPAPAPAAPTEAPAAAPLERSFVEGQHYFRIDPPQPTSSGERIEVIEVFSYACIHCATFQPFVAAWQARQPAHVHFAHMPAIFNPEWDLLARIYYTAEVLGILEQTHAATFQRIHGERQPLRNIAQAADFYASLGATDRETFIRTAESFAVNTKHSRARSMVPRYGIEGTPTMIVAGKYRVTGASAGGFEGILQVVDYLVAREHAAASGS